MAVVLAPPAALDVADTAYVLPATPETDDEEPEVEEEEVAVTSAVEDT